MPFHVISVASEGVIEMSAENDRAFHVERANQCRKMARGAADPAVRHLHEQLAEFHEAEARRNGAEMPADEGVD
jgi:hypothetical protein